jgi:hypothetical protein
MYNGRHFNREQLVYVVGVVLGSGFNFVESSLPPDGFDEEQWKKMNSVISEATQYTEWEGHIQTICGVVGWNLSVLYAQLTDDGMGTGDAIDAINYDDFLRDFSKSVAKWKIKQSKLPEDERSNRCYPVIWDKRLEQLAEKFVDECFYLPGFGGSPAPFSENTEGVHKDLADLLSAEIERKHIITYNQLDERIKLLLLATGLEQADGNLIHNLVMAYEASTMLTGE